MNSTKQVIEDYLKKHGISNQKEIDEIISGFDLFGPVYQQRIWVNDRLFQYVRRPNLSFNAIGVGRWFCLKGASMDSLAIFSGGVGRHLTEYRVKYPIVVLEGTAKKLSRNWEWAGGGEGGATQMFIPNELFFALEVLGTHI